MSNPVKDTTSRGGCIRGVHLTIAEPSIIEILASISLDFIYLDGEHGAFESRGIESCCVAAERHGLTAIARVPDRSAATITRFLDRGVKGLVVPHVDSPEDAREVLEAAYYSPLGSRSFGSGRPHFGLGIKDKVAHYAQCNNELSVCIMIESREALECAEEIAMLKGVDYLSFGMNDLAQSLGFPGEPERREVVDAVTLASNRIRATGKRVREDFMNFAWINEILVTGARSLLDERGP